MKITIMISTLLLLIQVPDGGCSLVIIDPPYGQGDIPDWDTKEMSWDSADLDSVLHKLVSNICKKTGSPFTVAVYTTMERLLNVTKVLHGLKFTDVHVVNISRLDVAFEQRSKSHIVVGTTRASHEKGSTTRSYDKAWHLPDFSSIERRPDLSVDPGMFNSKRLRCVEEYRFLVDRYSQPESWVLFLHTGDGASMVAAMLEGRHAIGVEHGSPVSSCSWRMGAFVQFEELLTKVHLANLEKTGGSSPQVGVLQEMTIAEMLQGIHDNNPVAASVEDFQVLRDTLAKDAKRWTQFMEITMSDSQFEELIKHAKVEMSNPASLKQFLSQKDQRLLWIASKWELVKKLAVTEDTGTSIDGAKSAMSAADEQTQPRPEM